MRILSRAIIAGVAVLFAGSVLILSTAAAAETASAATGGRVYQVQFPKSPGYAYVSSIRSFVDGKGDLNIKAWATNDSDEGFDIGNQDILCEVETSKGRIWIDRPDEGRTPLGANAIYVGVKETRAVTFKIKVPMATGRVFSCSFPE